MARGKRMTGSGPADVGAVLSGVGALAQAAAIGIAAWMASNTYQGWRRQKLSERRIEQAERILTAVYKARRALGYVRSPMMTAGELGDAENELKVLEGWDQTTEARRKKLAQAQAYFRRLKDVREDRVALDECLAMARALFGQETEQAIEFLGRQFHLVQVSAEALTWGSNSADPDDLRWVWSRLSSVSTNETPNEMNLLIEKQVELIENRLLPVLRLEAG